MDWVIDFCFMCGLSTLTYIDLFYFFASCVDSFFFFVSCVDSLLSHTLTLHTYILLHTYIDFRFISKMANLPKDCRSIGALAVDGMCALSIAIQTIAVMFTSSSTTTTCAMKEGFRSRLYYIMMCALSISIHTYSDLYIIHMSLLPL